MRIVALLLVVLGLASACGKRSQTTEPPAPPVSPGPVTPAVATPSDSSQAGSPDATAPATVEAAPKSRRRLRGRERGDTTSTPTARPIR